MNTYTIHKIALSLFLGGTLSVTSNSVMAVPPTPGISISQIPLSTGATGVIPNIMLMLDNSGSMSETFTSTSPAISINDALPAGYTYNCTVPRAGGATTAALATTISFMRTTDTSKRFCTSNKSTGCGSGAYTTFSSSNCFDNAKYYKLSYYTGSGNTGTPFGTFLGLNLNRYFTDGNFTTGSLTAVATTTSQTRMEVAQNAATGLVNSLTPPVGENPSVRLGLTTYNNGNGGRLLIAMDDLKSDSVQTNAINTAINNLSPGGVTPLATTLSDIGRYFCTGYTGNLTLHPGVTNTSDTIANIFNNHSLANAGTIPPIQSYCQKSAVILVSDGLPNGDRAVSSMLRNYTGDCLTITTSNTLCDATPNTNQFPGPTTPLTGTSSCSTNGNNPWTALCQNGSKKGRAYERNGSDYLDDVAVGLYDMDLRPTWTGMTWAGSSKPKNNLKTYAIGIADPALQADSVLRDAAQRTGGTFEYADNANKLIDALNKMVADIKKGTGSFSAITANSSSLGVGTALFQAKYDTTDWTGDLLALPLTNGGIVLNAAWNAGENIPAFLSRNIYTYNSSATIKGVKFQSQTAIQICTGLSATQKTALGISSCASTDTGVWLLDYVRGDISHEVVNPSHQLTYTTDPRLTATNRIFRNRARFYGSDAIAPKKEGDLRNPDPWLLGDIINSDVLFVGNTENFDYANLAGTKSLEGTTYDAFVTEKSKRRKMVYVGANDGMLHGFDARIPPTGTTDPEAGKEILAYIPNTVIDRLDSLSNPSYSHLYFVDGSPQANDVYLPNVAPVVPSNNWHTVLVGTTGAGGKGVFALDVTDPGTFGASNVLWEVSNTDGPISGDVTMDNPNPPIANKGRGFAKNLGYTLPQAAMGKMHNGDWAAIVANGYSSDNNLGVLYILNIQTGAIIAAIDTKQISAGLSAPLIVDIDGDGIVDSIYAGDLVGNMWKFDVSDSDPKKWKIAYGTNAAPAPLFIACTDATSTATCDATRQPITASPQESSVGSAQATGGSMVYFGTGKYFEDSDNNVANTQTQSFYAVWDECPLANSSTPAPTATCSTVAKTALVKQSIIAQLAPSATVPFNVRATSNTAVNYPTQKGWYIDFVNPNTNANEGERIVSASLLQNGDIIFATLVPSPPTINNADPNALCNAGTKSTSWVMEFDALSGSRLTSPVLDINNDGKFDSGDQVTVTVGGVEISVPVSGFQTIGSTRTPVILTDAAATSTTGGGSTTGGTTTGGTTGGGTTSGGTTTGGTTTDGNSGSDGGVTGVTAKSSSGTECINGDEASCIKRQDLPPSDKGASRQSWRQL